MLSKNQQKLIRALGQKKQRKLQGKFLVQGEKNVLELLDSNMECEQLFVTNAFFETNQKQLQEFKITVTDEDSLSKVSTLSSNNAAIAVVKTPAQGAVDTNGLIIALDGVSDPGNLGTIIRLADWYGIKTIVCSEDCADVYNPKTISATMGSFTRINVVTTDLVEYLEKTTKPVYGAFLDGKSVHKTELNQEAVLLMGSESHGIRSNVEPLVTDKITIPSFGQAESLNVAMATGIILDNIKRIA